MLTYLQYVDSAKSEDHAKEMFDFCSQQLDFCGGRILPPVNQVGRDCWRIQVFFRDNIPEDVTLHWFPDGIRRVIVPEGQRKALGLF